MPAGTRKLTTRGPSTCAGSPATSLRGREAIRIEGDGGRGGALYLSLSANLAGVSSRDAGEPFERWRPKETAETAEVLANIHYADGSTEDQFPLLVKQRRHVLLNRTPELYSIALDPARVLASVELLDRSPHVQLVLFHAGLSASAAPLAADASLATPSPAREPAGESSLKGSRWYQLRPVHGKPHSRRKVRAQVVVKLEADGRSASLTLTNTSKDAREFTLIFPSLKIRPAAKAADVYYLFPAQRAIAGQDENPHEANYAGSFPLQFLDVFSPAANTGTCVIVRDSEG
ncbi:MAG: hypothetical protein NTY38_16165, partial [Acidobacteria bacterium]|nr:hypothetical protein [Acidobacteriota bacterium]